MSPEGEGLDVEPWKVWVTVYPLHEGELGAHEDDSHVQDRTKAAQLPEQLSSVVQ